MQREQNISTIAHQFHTLKKLLSLKVSISNVFKIAEKRYSNEIQMLI